MSVWTCKHGTFAVPDGHTHVLCNLCEFERAAELQERIEAPLRRERELLALRLSESNDLVGELVRWKQAALPIIEAVRAEHQPHRIRTYDQTRTLLSLTGVECAVCAAIDKWEKETSKS